VAYYFATLYIGLHTASSL